MRRLILIATVWSASLVAGCTASPKDVYQKVKELEPKAHKRNQEIRELTGVPADEAP